jgi:hypothetical protein
MKNYKVLSLWEPWASLVVAGIKKIETRPSPTNWTIEKGTYLIHAAKKWTKDQQMLCMNEPFHCALAGLQESSIIGQEFALGYIIGSVDVIECCLITTLANDINIWPNKNESFNVFNLQKYDGIRVTEPELSFGNYREGRYAWILSNPRILVNPILYKGGQGYYQNFKGDVNRLIFKKIN